MIQLHTKYCSKCGCPVYGAVTVKGIHLLKIDKNINYAPTYLSPYRKSNNLNFLYKPLLNKLINTFCTTAHKIILNPITLGVHIILFNPCMWLSILASRWNLGNTLYKTYLKKKHLFFYFILFFAAITRRVFQSRT